MYNKRDLNIRGIEPTQVFSDKAMTHIHSRITTLLLHLNC